MARTKSRTETRLKAIRAVTVEGRIALAHQKCAELANLLIEIERTHANNRHLTYDRVFGNNLTHVLAGNAFGMVRLSSFAYEVTRMIALWDGPAADRVSIPEIAALIDDPVVKEVLLDRFLANYGRDHERDHILHERARRRFERDYRIVTRLGPAVERSSRLVTLKDHRNKWFAHNLTTAALSPKFGYERKMRLISHKVANALTSVIRSTGFDYGNTIRLCREQADAFWGGLSWSASSVQVEQRDGAG